jgi:uncharacterized membrane protein
MAKTKTKNYQFLRFITICLTTVMLPFGTFVGYEFGSGHTRAALIALAVQTAITFLQSYIWWKTMEKVGGH